MQIHQQIQTPNTHESSCNINNTQISFAIHKLLAVFWDEEDKLHPIRIAYERFCAELGRLDRADGKERARKKVANLQGRSCRSGREDTSREGPAAAAAALPCVSARCGDVGWMDGCEMRRVAVDGAMGGCGAPRLLRAPPSFQRAGLGLRRRDQKEKGNV